MQNAEPGWYVDPQDPSMERWWTGAAWGEQARRSLSVAPLPSPPPPPVVPNITHPAPTSSIYTNPQYKDERTNPSPDFDEVHLKNQTTTIVYVWGVLQVVSALCLAWVLLAAYNEEYVSSLAVLIVLLAPVGGSIMAAMTVWWLARQLELLGLKSSKAPAHSVWWTPFLLVVPWYFAMFWLSGHVYKTLQERLPRSISLAPARSVKAAVTFHLCSAALAVLLRSESVIEYKNGNVAIAALVISMGLTALSGFLLLSAGGMGRCVVAVVRAVASTTTNITTTTRTKNVESTGGLLIHDTGVPGDPNRYLEIAPDGWNRSIEDPELTWEEAVLLINNDPLLRAAGWCLPSPQEATWFRQQRSQIPGLKRDWYWTEERHPNPSRRKALVIDLSPLASTKNLRWVRTEEKHRVRPVRRLPDMAIGETLPQPNLKSN